MHAAMVKVDLPAVKEAKRASLQLRLKSLLEQRMPGLTIFCIDRINHTAL